MTTIASLLRRFERIEAKQSTGRITQIVNFTDCKDTAAEAVANWQEWVRDGRAHRAGETLIIMLPSLTVEEWEAQTAHLRGEPIH
jgi:hypothetical protein